MSKETLQCGKRSYQFESRITKNGHKYLLITEKSSGRVSKIMVFHDYYDPFHDALARAMGADPEAEDPASLEGSTAH